MKRFINIAVFCLVGWLLLSGCYDDKGSYDYQDINELIIDLPTIVSVRLSCRSLYGSVLDCRC